MIDAHLIFIFLIIIVIIVGESTMARSILRETFYGCNPSVGCSSCGGYKGGCGGIAEGFKEDFKEGFKEYFDPNNRIPAEYINHYELQMKQACQAGELDTQSFQQQPTGRSLIRGGLLKEGFDGNAEESQSAPPPMISEPQANVETTTTEESAPVIQ